MDKETEEKEQLVIEGKTAHLADGRAKGCGLSGGREVGEATLRTEKNEEIRGGGKSCTFIKGLLSSL